MSCPNHRLEAFSAAVLPLREKVVALARALSPSEADAEEIAQECMLRAWKYFDRFQPGSAMPWLAAIVRNTCRTWPSRHDPPVSPRRPVRQAPDVFREAAIREMVERLPPDLRLVFQLCDITGLSCTEASARCGLPRQTVYRRLRRARMELREMLAHFR